MSKNKVTVSVCMITYNQEQYIKQAIEGVLMQQCDFLIELIIGEDCSTDNTKQICEDYASKYPQIKLLSIQSNLGAMPNFIRTLQVCTGKYIAICEGDDYWTDPLKLQKQVEFMEKNYNTAFCFHNAKTHFIDTDIVDDFNKNLSPGYFGTKDLLIKEWFIPTASLLFRTNYLPNHFPEWFYKAYSGDFALELLLSTKGDFYYIDEKMSVYRKNAINSLSATQINPYNHLFKRIILLVNFAKSQSFLIKTITIYSIFLTQLQILRAKTYAALPFTVLIKNNIKRIIA